MDAAGIGRKIAADLAAAFGSQAEREEPVLLSRGLLNRLQHAARLGGQSVVDGIHRPHAVHTRQVDQNLVAVFARNLRTHQPVFPPCGTMATSASAHTRTMAATSAVLAGWSRIGVLP